MKRPVRRALFLLLSGILLFAAQGCQFLSGDQLSFIGMSRQQVFDALGDADSVFYGSTTCTPGIDNGADALFVYDDVHLSFRMSGPSVLEITILSGGTEGGFDNGLRVGLTRAEALAILGGSCCHIPYDLKDFYQYSPLGLNLEVLNRSDLVSEINITCNILHGDL